MSRSAYSPLEPARSPGAKPGFKPAYRLLVHRKYASRWDELVDRVGIQGARQFYEHVTNSPGQPSPLASITIMRGKVGRPMSDGWSRTHHYEVSGAGRVNYQYHNAHKTREDGDEHAVVAILTIDYGSH